MGIIQENMMRQMPQVTNDASGAVYVNTGGERETGGDSKDTGPQDGNQQGDGEKLPTMQETTAKLFGGMMEKLFAARKVLTGSPAVELVSGTLEKVGEANFLPENVLAALEGAGLNLFADLFKVVLNGGDVDGVISQLPDADPAAKENIDRELGDDDDKDLIPDGKDETIPDGAGSDGDEGKPSEESPDEEPEKRKPGRPKKSE